MAKKTKGKKGKKDNGPEPMTTVTVLDERAKMLCPRLGDTYTRTALVESILEEVCAKVIEKAVNKKASSLHLNAMKLERLPDLSRISNHLHSIVELDLSRNNLFHGDLLFQQLSNMPQLIKLNLSNNFLNGDLSKISGNLVNLEELNLDVNQLSNLNPAAVSAWSKLRIFSATDNNLTSIPLECSAWVNIESVDLRNNKIGEIPSSLFVSWKNNLKRLYVGYNLLKTMPTEIGECTQLEEVEFSNNAIDAVPMSFANCTKMKQLHLGNNKISEIPAEVIAGLSHLKELQLYKNKITTLPAEIGLLHDIERLSFSSNNIKKVPEEIGGCTNLKELYLSNNKKLAVIPSSAGHLRCLKELSLRKCPALKQLPPTIAELSDLRELDIRAPKKQVCKITPEMALTLKRNHCIIRGGVVKKGKAPKKSKKSA